MALVRFPIVPSDAVQMTPLTREHLVLAVRHDSPLARNDELATSPAWLISP
ncbi:hypothetical protein JEV30_23890 [Pseudomonas aeruginosa]|nr:hypothetical protein [Pseudomonas aeruginosa]